MTMEAQLKNELDQAEWTMLRPHLERDAIIVVDQELDLVEVAKEVVMDNTEAIDNWLKNKKVYKPTPDQVNFWDNNHEKRFIFLIVQPYVLIQEISN